MASENKIKDIPDYVKNAINAFGVIMSNKQKHMLEDINRVNKGELFVLHFLSMKETAVLPSELSTALNSSTARISALLGSLEKKGHIERDIDKSNRRNILVTLTESGRERVKIETGKMEENLARAFIEMGEPDAKEFLRLLKQFLEINSP
ncbi:MAG: transcriptional regulator [Defluviitaleaceae bacterium]|nr:transcriptional regulator [Defluviitaleaceae bacterium]MCL2836336.1 transcriptional regulator [Defluviitaleaceae bacterium]